MQPRDLATLRLITNRASDPCIKPAHASRRLFAFATTKVAWRRFWGFCGPELDSHGWAEKVARRGARGFGCGLCLPFRKLAFILTFEPLEAKQVIEIAGA